jgi:serine/threonine-protein kinase
MAGLEGVRLGNYQIVRRIGGGGMGDVYLAEQLDLGRQVAIKVLRGDTNVAASNEEQRQAIERFIIEARAIASLEHPHIIPLYDFGVQNSILYLVMQYVPSGSLSDFFSYTPLQRYRLPFHPHLAADLIAQSASALQFAHDHNIVHLDVKPQNLLLRILPLSNVPVPFPPPQSGPAFQAGGSAGEIPVQLHLLLADFGLARFITWISGHNKVTGTPLYTAPEQYAGRSSPATDQYALAGVAYLLLTGVPVFTGTLPELYHQHLSVTPRPITQINPQLPPTLNDVFARALAKEPTQRFPRIQDFSQALQHAIRVLGQPQPYWMPRSSVEGAVGLAPPQPGQPQPLGQAGPSIASPAAYPWPQPNAAFQNMPGAATVTPPMTQPSPQSVPAPNPSLQQGWFPSPSESDWSDAPTLASTSPSVPVPPVYAPPGRSPAQPELYAPTPPPFGQPVPAPPESQHLPDAPRAPLPRSAKKLANRPGNPLRQVVVRARQFPLWQRLALAGLVCLLLVGSIAALLLTTRHPQTITQSGQLSITTKNLVRYGSLDASSFPAMSNPPPNESTLPARLRTPRAPDMPDFIHSLPAIPGETSGIQADANQYPSSLPTPLNSSPIKGITQQQAGIDSPQDISLASNATTTLEVVDGALFISRSANRLIGIASFFQQILNQGDILGETRILFDSGLGQWILVANQLSATANGAIKSGSLDIAISESANPLGNWTIYQLNSGLSTYTTCNWADYPQIGSNAISIFITATSFTCGQNGALLGPALWVLPKGVLSTGAVETVYVVTGFKTDTGNPVVTLTPSSEGSQDTTEWLVSNDSGYVDGGQTSTQLVVWTVIESTQGNSPFVPTVLKTPITLVHPYADPPLSQQASSSVRLFTGDARITQSQLVNGHLYAAFTTAMNWTGDPSTRAAIFWVDLLPTLTTKNASDPAHRQVSVRINQQGIYGSGYMWFFYPVIAADASGNMVLFSEVAASWLYPHLMVTSRRQSDPANLFGGAKRNFVFLPVDSSPFGGQHWGDYLGGAAVTDGATSSVWVAGPYIDSHTQTWQTTLWQIPM